MKTLFIALSLTLSLPSFSAGSPEGVYRGKVGASNGTVKITPKKSGGYDFSASSVASPSGHDCMIEGEIILKDNSGSITDNNCKISVSVKGSELTLSGEIINKEESGCEAMFCGMKAQIFGKYQKQK